MEKRLETLKLWIRDISGPIGLGFSGGVDSAFLLTALSRWCRFPVRPFCAVSIFFPTKEQVSTAQIANEIGVEPYYFTWEPLSQDPIRNNHADRCYFCKKYIYTTILDTARQMGIKCIVDGTQADDLGRHRPGLKALEELNIQTPLADCGIDKDFIRYMLKEWEFGFWDKASESCLATRIATNTLISNDNLKIIEKLEDFFIEKRFNLPKIRIINKSIYIFANVDEIERIKMYFKEMERIGEGFRFFLKI